MAERDTLQATPRTATRRRAARQLRRDGVVPAVVYGSGREPLTVQVNAHDFTLMLQHHGGENLLVDLDVPGHGKAPALVKEVQQHPVSGHVLHVDFHEISMTEKIEVEVSIHLVGEPVGVTQDGGILEHVLRHVTVASLPTDILESIEVDVSELQIGDHVTVADISLDTSKYDLLTETDLSVASVAPPRVVEEEEEPEEGEGLEGEEEPGEVEVITEKKEESED